MTLVEHAEVELRRTGWLDEENEQSGRAMLEAVRAFAAGGWSGASAPYGVHIVEQLLSYKPLGPLTDNPAEWNHVADEIAGQPDLWQSARRPDAFSNDGGLTYYCLDEMLVRYDKWPHLLWKLKLRERPVGFTRGKDQRKLKRHRAELST